MKLKALSDDELNLLDELLAEHVSEEGLNRLSALDGYLTAIISGPLPIAEAQWLPAIGILEAAPEALSTLIRRHHHALGQLLAKGSGELSPLFEIDDVDGQELPMADVWAAGYLHGVNVADWPDIDEEAHQWLERIALLGDERFATALEDLPHEEWTSSAESVAIAAMNLHSWWLPQRSSAG